MSQPRLGVIAILGVTTVTAAGLAFQQYQRAQSLAEELAAAREAEKSVAMRIAEETNNQTASEATSPEAELVASTETVAEETEAEDSREDSDRRRPDRNAMAARFQEMMNDPEIARAMQLSQRSRLDGRYAELFAKLNLPPATLSQLQDLLVERQNVTRDVFMAAREEGFGRGDRDQLRDLIEITQGEIDAEIRETIGEQAYSELQNYEQTGRQRALVEQLEDRLSYSATPLNEVQATTLTNILASTSGGGNNGGNNRTSAFGGNRGGSVQITDAALSQAQAVLSPDQYSALQALQEEQQASQMLSQAMREQANAARQGVEGGGRSDRAGGGNPGGGG